jgi:pyruvate formate lyase activating enzyme
MRLVGRRTTAADVLAEVERDRVFYQHSKGGMTISGGEPLAQPDFTLALIAGARAMAVRSAVETAGVADSETLQRVLGQTDLILFDIKHMDAPLHRSVVGDDNATILRNARLACGLGVEMIIRVPVIPGFNDQLDQISAIGEYARSLGVPELHLLPYHRYGAAKYALLGRTYEMPDAPPPTRAQLETLRLGMESSGMVVRALG